HFLEHHDGGAQEDHRQGGLSDRLERGPVTRRRQAVLALFLLDLVGERPAGGGGRPVCRRQEGGQTGDDRAQLPGGQGLRRRLQGALRQATGQRTVAGAR